MRAIATVRRLVDNTGVADAYVSSRAELNRLRREWPATEYWIDVTPW